MKKKILDSLTDIKEIQSILGLAFDARTYLEEFEWCKKVKNYWYDQEFRVYNKIGVFLFEIKPSSKEVDNFVWVIVGDIPSVYLDQSIQSGREALKAYCSLMEEWCENIINGESISECFPVEAEPNHENANLLLKRISFIKRELLMEEKQ